jgi:hypothetical protein
MNLEGGCGVLEKMLIDGRRGSTISALLTLLSFEEGKTLDLGCWLMMLRDGE